MRTKGEHRLNMLNLILKDIIGELVPIYIKDIEIENNKYYPTCDLLTEFQKLFPEYTFIFCIGADLVESLPKWDKGEYLMENQQFIILTRPQYLPSLNDFPKTFRLLETTIDCSSTEIRGRIENYVKFTKKK